MVHSHCRHHHQKLTCNVSVFASSFCVLMMMEFYGEIVMMMMMMNDVRNCDVMSEMCDYVQAM